jgi:hypothetical protein
VEEAHCVDSVSEVASASAVVAQDAPVLETSDGVFDACSPTSMMAPGPAADDPVAAKTRRSDWYEARHTR